MTLTEKKLIRINRKFTYNYDMSRDERDLNYVTGIIDTLEKVKLSRQRRGLAWLWVLKTDSMTQNINTDLQNLFLQVKWMSCCLFACLSL